MLKGTNANRLNLPNIFSGFSGFRRKLLTISLIFKKFSAIFTIETCLFELCGGQNLCANSSIKITYNIPILYIYQIFKRGGGGNKNMLISRPPPRK